MSRRIIATALAAAGVTLVTAAGSAGAAPAEQAVTGTAVAAPTTRVVVRVAGCEGCVLYPSSVQQKDGGALRIWRGRRATVTDGVIRFTIPTRFTKGMSLGITAPWEKGELGASLLVALSEGVPSPYDPAYREGQHCWAGTRAKRAVIHVTVTRESGRSPYGGRAVWPLAWSTAIPQPKDAPGHQDLPYCPA